MSPRNCLSVAVMSFAALFLGACGGAATPTLIAPTAAALPLPPTAAAPTKAPTSEPTATALPPTVEPTTEPTAAPTQPGELSGTAIDRDHPIFKAYFAVYNKFPRRTYSEIFNPAMQETATVLSETDARDQLRVEIDYGDMIQSLVIISPTIYSLEDGTWRKTW